MTGAVMSPVLLTLAAALAAPAHRERKSDPPSLVGEWAEAGTTDGLVVEFTTDGVVMFRAGPRPPDADRYRLDPAKRPAEIDIEPFDAHQIPGRGNYKVEAHTLTLCLANTVPRPTRFEASPGSKSVLLVLKRVKRKE
jgi:uncharacterized protein (TIGR03067 family)